MKKVEVETFRTVTLNFNAQEYQDLLLILHAFKTYSDELGLSESNPSAMMLADALLETLNA